MAFEELGVLAEDAIENALAQIGNGGETNEIDKIIAEIIANTFDAEDEDDAEGNHGPDVVDPGG